MKTESKIVIDTKEKLLEHFGKPEGDFFGISDSYMMSLERGQRIQSRMVDNYLRLIFSFYPKEIEI